MSPTPYSLSTSISTFLSTHSSTTRSECDSLAQSLLSSPTISPVPIQGSFSYTVVASDSQLAQFRSPTSPLDVEVLRLAREIYGGDVVAKTEFWGNFGGLGVYLIEKLQGVTYLEWLMKGGLGRRLDGERFERQRGLVGDFARFFAAAWKTPQTADIAATRQTCENNLHLLARNLPDRFSRDILELTECLDSIFQTLPMVLTHGDLCEMNFLVDERSGHLTGVIDWAEAEILPFGFNLWGVENLLGYMDGNGWNYFEGYEELRGEFWTVFYGAVGAEEEEGEGDGVLASEVLCQKQETIDVARRMGILFRYGFFWDEDLRKKVPVQEGDSGMRYLDAFFLG
ncbi:uncharacterized protein SEPMUDRAFT_136875 [Sphaerulina musiva SO2202]|uniref:Aminoglycoside phosphotransferase domain-containing protein n=1 Tax=Sphaerulina musiva (strain SO2202) TaxID=692275 RepID=M3BPF9_SPHMS|nr:uncharacterized protein SEPMUDRAFT_136875 [Sphaerulina musiva SO2202]EMF08053.1 hypothetical protein SEPMUDRAFT_136875 [Sphaerulina musiva SO2202]